MKQIILTFFLSTTLLLNAQINCITDWDKDKIPQSLVVDFADILTNDQEQALKQKLIAFSNETSNQILVISVDDLCGMEPGEFATRLGHKWGVGQDEFDNGVVVLIKPHGGKGERHSYIAVGQGLEGVITDVVSFRIVRQEMIPEFQNGNFNEGINKGVDTIMGIAKGEINTDKYKSKSISLWPILIILLIIFFVLFSNIQRVRRHAIGKDISFWAALWLLSNSGHRRSSSWNHFHSGGGSFGGGSGFGGGSSFGGFGGGSFGGGGAGGSW